jgi:hypothetical protein
VALVVILVVFAVIAARPTPAGGPPPSPVTSFETIRASALGEMSASPSSAATLDPAALKAAAAKAYLTIAATYNKAIDAANKVCAKVSNNASARSCGAHSAAAELAFYTAVNALVFPPDAVADQRALVRGSSAEYVYFRQMAVAKTAADFNAAERRASQAANTSAVAANTVRLDLGLPPVPVH